MVQAETSQERPIVNLCVGKMAPEASRRSKRQEPTHVPCRVLELPQAEPPRCLQDHWVGVIVGVGRIHHPADRELLLVLDRRRRMG
jgi:hypothetical protein